MPNNFHCTNQVHWSDGWVGGEVGLGGEGDDFNVLVSECIDGNTVPDSVH